MGEGGRGTRCMPLLKQGHFIDAGARVCTCMQQNRLLLELSFALLSCSLLTDVLAPATPLQSTPPTAAHPGVPPGAAVAPVPASQPVPQHGLAF